MFKYIYMRKIVFISLVLLPFFTFAQVKRATRNKYVPVYEKYTPQYDDVSDYDEFRYWDGQKYRTVGGRYHIVHYKAMTGSTVSAAKIHRFYNKLIMKKTHPVQLYSGTSDPANYKDDLYQSVYRFDVGTRQVWVQFLTLNKGAEYEIVEIEGRERRNELSASQMKSEIDSMGKVDIYINFDVNRYNIRPESEIVIEEVAKLMQQNSDLNFIIEGHTDNTGSAARNKSLSLQRAKAVKKALIANGIKANRMETIGYGSEKPIASNAADEGRAKNRRVALVRKN